MKQRLELVEFKTPDNYFMPGLLFEPIKKTKTVAIYLHGNGSGTVMDSVYKLNLLAERLTDTSTAFLAFNNRGSGYIRKVKRIRSGKLESIKLGTAYELIRDCVYDIDGALNFLKKRGYKKFILIGFSTGANKICVYNFYKPKNAVSRYVVVAGGDDAGIYYQQLGGKKFHKTLQTAKNKIRSGHGRELAKIFPKYNLSYQSLYDTINPDGDYNTFPFYEYTKKLKLSKKPMFRHYQSIKKPTLVIYGSDDEYCSGEPEKMIEILKQKSSSPSQFSFQIINNADHGFTGKEKELANAIANWIK